MRNIKFSGSTLLMSIVLLIILSMIAITAMHSVRFQIKMARNIQYSIQALYAAEAGLKMGEQMIQTQKRPHCYYAKKNHTPWSNTYFIKSALSWWFSNATCAMNMDDFKIYYVIEEYSMVDCDQIKNQDQIGTEYFRITSKAIGEEGRGIRLLQTTFAAPAKKNTCLGRVRWINKGRQSWRQLV